MRRATQTAAYLTLLCAPVLRCSTMTLNHLSWCSSKCTSLSYSLGMPASSEFFTTAAPSAPVRPRALKKRQLPRASAPRDQIPDRRKLTVRLVSKLRPPGAKR